MCVCRWDCVRWCECVCVTVQYMRLCFVCRVSFADSFRLFFFLPPSSRSSIHSHMLRHTHAHKCKRIRKRVGFIRVVCLWLRHRELLCTSMGWRLFSSKAVGNRTRSVLHSGQRGWPNVSVTYGASSRSMLQYVFLLVFVDWCSGEKKTVLIVNPVHRSCVITCLCVCVCECVMYLWYINEMLRTQKSTSHKCVCVCNCRGNASGVLQWIMGPFHAHIDMDINSVLHTCIHTCDVLVFSF